MTKKGAGKAQSRAVNVESGKNTGSRAVPAAFVAFRTQVLGRAPEEHSFYLADGRQLHDLHELAQSFQDMADSVFHHHVNPGRNDFGNWARDVMGDQELADMLSAVKSQMDAELAVLRRISDRLQRGG